MTLASEIYAALQHEDETPEKPELSLEEIADQQETKNYIDWLSAVCPDS
jgi:hypothetical protein